MARLTEYERRVIVQRLLAGESPTTLSQQFPVSRQYLSALKSRLRHRDRRKDAPAEFDFLSAKDEIRRKAYPAVSDALDDPSDIYKRGRLGLETLRGTGDLYAENQVNVSVKALIAQVPDDWVQEFTLTPGAADEEHPEGGMLPGSVTQDDTE